MSRAGNLPQPPDLAHRDRPCLEVRWLFETCVMTSIKSRFLHLQVTAGKESSLYASDVVVSAMAYLAT